ncbi:isocitrate lyase/PEP mutase family protein [Sandarakinorhabdus sp. DWP1-3-1]|uniref:isocitrate lyase/PEP mutase family protein n=1 Tax=Sandarakinorhabdus sp. DWP1-3-1 TaxID=2804627 RepID=UPI003CFAA6A8
MTTAFSSRAARFRAAHAGPELLRLANAWDVGSARLIESLGAPAIATTSAGMAWSLGFPDGDALPLFQHLNAVKAIVAAVKLPVTVDIEGGYSDEPKEVGAAVGRFAAAGAVGINIEDGAGTPELLAAKIKAARRPDLFINARCDVWLRALAPGKEHAETMRRAAIYAAAGADCIFVPGVTDADAITRLASDIRDQFGLPLNVLARDGVPDAPALAAMGVRRLSAGSGITQAVYGLARTLAHDFLTGDASTVPGTITYGEINSLMG